MMRMLMRGVLTKMISCDQGLGKETISHIRTTTSTVRSFSDLDILVLIVEKDETLSAAD